jgi:glycerophosphoryl diester phosphodiesterase
MIKVTVLGSVLLSAAACVSNLPAPSPPATTPSPQAQTKNAVLFFGHRGAAGEAPENTLAAFQRGIDDGVDAIELDVHLSKDNELVVMHDPHIERSTNGRGLVRDLTLAELAQFNASAKYNGFREYGTQRIPTLSEVLDLTAGRVDMVIEIKLDAEGHRYPGIEQQVVELVRRYKVIPRTTIGSFDFDTLQEIQRLEPGLRRTAFISIDYLKKMGFKFKGPEDIAKDIASSSALSVGVDKAYLSEPLISAFKQAGLGVGAWTVDDFVEMWKLIDWGVDTITTNQPSLLLDKYKQGRNAK